jgi:hypothetical protein
MQGASASAGALAFRYGSVITPTLVSVKMRAIWIIVHKSFARIFARAASACVEAANQVERRGVYDYSRLE